LALSYNHQVKPPATPEEGYHLTEDLAQRAIEFIGDAKQVDPDKPFFTHFCRARLTRLTKCPKSG